MHATYDSWCTHSGHLINNLWFVDDIALLAESEDNYESLVNAVHASTNMGLKIPI